MNSQSNYTINSSNKLKIQEFKKYLPGEVTINSCNVEEPKSDEITIIRYKASQFEDVIVDDSSLEIQGVAVGPLIKWHLHELEQYAGRRASFICLLAVNKNKKIYLYRGEVAGAIVQSRGEKYGFLSYFQPDGSSKTLAEELPDRYNARFYAVQELLNNQAYAVHEPLYTWDGIFQGKE